MSNQFVTEHCVPNDYDLCMFCGEDMSNDYKS